MRIIRWVYNLFLNVYLQVKNRYRVCLCVWSDIILYAHKPYEAQCVRCPFQGCRDIWNNPHTTDTTSIAMESADDGDDDREGFLKLQTMQAIESRRNAKRIFRNIAQFKAAGTS